MGILDLSEGKINQAVTSMKTFFKTILKIWLGCVFTLAMFFPYTICSQVSNTSDQLVLEFDLFTVIDGGELYVLGIDTSGELISKVIDLKSRNIVFDTLFDNAINFSGTRYIGEEFSTISWEKSDSVEMSGRVCLFNSIGFTCTPDTFSLPFAPNGVPSVQYSCSGSTCLYEPKVREQALSNLSDSMYLYFDGVRALAVSSRELQNTLLVGQVDSLFVGFEFLSKDIYTLDSTLAKIEVAEPLFQEFDPDFLLSAGLGETVFVLDGYIYRFGVVGYINGTNFENQYHAIFVQKLNSKLEEIDITRALVEDAINFSEGEIIEQATSHCFHVNSDMTFVIGVTWDSISVPNDSIIFTEFDTLLNQIRTYRLDMGRSGRLEGIASTDSDSTYVLTTKQIFFNPDNSITIKTILYYIDRYDQSTSVQSIAEEVPLALSVFPNPAKDVIYVDYGELIPVGYNYEIYDTSGRLMSKNLYDHSSGIEVACLKNGFYSIIFYPLEGRGRYGQFTFIKD